MSKIHIMPDVLASQVAAGEVVERPASVIKELIENSLDAGARTISVEIRRGGFAQMKVTDDGCGMTQEDAMLCLERHATSKLLSVEDLFEISHLGFRGEALPSIASVSRVKIRTKERESLEGVEIEVEGGVMKEPRIGGMPPGTCIEVNDLFFNTPARKKFLKSEETESAHIEHQIRMHALAFPSVRFIFRKNGQLVFDLPAAADTRIRIASLFDSDTATGLLSMSPQYGPGITINGFLAPLTETRRTKKGQFIFLNKRPIEDKLVSRAIRDGYGGLPTGLHPSLYLYIDIEPALVDVNVHPAKKEVRFRRPSDVVTAIIESISSTLSNASKAPSLPTPIEQPIKPEEAIQSITPEVMIPSNQATATPIAPVKPIMAISPAGMIKKLPATQASLDIDPPKKPEAEQPFPFRFIGTLKGRYGLFEGEDGLVLLFPRAARERIIFEQLMRNKDKNVPGQALLDPILIELDPRDHAVLIGLQQHFDQAGISLAPFGQRTVRIESIPAILDPSEAKSFILDLIDRITHSEFSKKASHLAFETFAAELALKSSRLEKINLTHAISLFKELLRCEIPYCTPGGKPTIVMYSMQEMAKKFGIS